MNLDWHDLIQRYTAGTLTDDEALALQNALKSDKDIRALYLDYMNLDVALGSHAESRAAVNEMLASPITLPSRPARWLSWRPLTAAAAGIVFGIFCSSVVFAYVGPSLGKMASLLEDSFESGPAPLVTGVPAVPGVWSGDYMEVVGEQQGVKPASGKKMSRLLRADYEGKTSSEPTAVADIYRLIDVRPWRQEFADGSAVVQFSAGFNAFAFTKGESYQCKIYVQAFDEETVTNGSLRVGKTRNDRELAIASTGRTMLDRNPATWQLAKGELLLPPETDFLMIHIAVKRAPQLPPTSIFAGHYLDDVHLTLRHRPLF